VGSGGVAAWKSRLPASASTPAATNSAVATIDAASYGDSTVARPRTAHTTNVPTPKTAATAAPPSSPIPVATFAFLRFSSVSARAISRVRGG
jgi:hypothetical protein